MKKLLYLFAFAILTSLAACGGGEETPQVDEEKKAEVDKKVDDIFNKLAEEEEEEAEADSTAAE